MRIDVNSCFFVLGLCLLTSCGSPDMNKGSFLAYLNDPINGYVQRKAINGVGFEVKFIPSDLMAFGYMKSGYADEELDSISDFYSAYLCFKLLISHDNRDVLSTIPKTSNAYGEMVSQLSFGMYNKVSLVASNTNEFPLQDYNYSRLYGALPYTELLFVFERKKLKGSNLTFKIEEFGLNTGLVSFEFDVKRIKYVPRIDFNEKTV